MSINGSKCGFDGFKVGLNGFENPMKDGEVEACKAAIGMGCKLKWGYLGQEGWKKQCVCSKDAQIISCNQ